MLQPPFGMALIGRRRSSGNTCCKQHSRRGRLSGDRKFPKGIVRIVRIYIYARILYIYIYIYRLFGRRQSGNQMFLLGAKPNIGCAFGTTGQAAGCGGNGYVYAAVRVFLRFVVSSLGPCHRPASSRTVRLSRSAS